MITLRLFREDTPDRQIDSYIMGDGEVTVGRDPRAVWVIDDPDRRLSRFHCTMAVRNGNIFVRDTSANGVFVGTARERIEPSSEASVAPGETLQIGQYVLVVDQDKTLADDGPDHTASLTSSAPLQNTDDEAQTNAIPDEWADPALEAAPQNKDGVLGEASEVAMLEAFCEGAQLDPSYLASEQPADVMRRVGEVYRQVVLGLGDLMSERAAVKSEYSLERTTIGATDNNPLKWAPTHRVAIDLISERTGGFLGGADAVKECFEDLKGHSLCLVAGTRSAVSVVLETFDPQVVESEAKEKAPFFMERSEAAWRRVKALHAELSSDPFNDANSLVNASFRQGYERRSSALRAKDANE